MKKCIFYSLFLLFQVASGYGQVTFIIQQIPANTPVNDTLYNAGSFTNWNEGSFAHKLANIGSGAFALSGGIVAAMKTMRCIVSFPDPVGDFFTIQSCENCTALVFDTTGRLIADFTEILQSEPATADGWQTLYGLNQLLKPGMFHLKVYNQNNQAIYSLLKQ